MRRLLVLPLALLLCAAHPAGVTVAPDPPLLGRPLAVTFSLVDAETTLAGLPALGSFELLLPPHLDHGTLRLLLLPMRPGLQTLPPLPLHQGGSARSATPELALTVHDDLPADALPAPLLSATAPPAPAARSALFAALAGLLLIGAGALLLRWRRHRPRPLPAPTDDERLAGLQRRLEPLLATDPVAAELHRQLLQLRFAPGAATPQQLQELQAAVTTRCAEAA